MVLPLADAQTLMAANASNRKDEIIKEIDTHLAQAKQFPFSISFSLKESEEVLILVGKDYQAAGYSVLIYSAYVTNGNQDSVKKYLLKLHSAPNSFKHDGGSSVVFKA